MGAATTLKIMSCKDCERAMIPDPTYRKCPDLRQQYCCHTGHGLCTACYRRARLAGTLPYPAPRTAEAPQPPAKEVAKEVAKVAPKAASAPKTLAVQRVEPPTDGVRRQAALAVCQRAHDVADAAELLAMLGLFDESADQPTMSPAALQ
jgi:hypothetical protein